MKKITTAGAESSVTASPVWESLERYAREGIQQFVQRLLEEEVDDLLGRKKSKRRSEESAPGYRNGYARARKLSLSSGTVTVERPRVRDLEERFVSRLLPLFKRRRVEVGALLPELYLHGLSLGDFELALRGLLGEGAPSPQVRFFGSRLRGKSSTTHGSDVTSPISSWCISGLMGST